VSQIASRHADETISTVAAGPPAVEISHLHKAYGRKIALHDLDLTVQPGEVFGFLGPNGAGKTTTVKILLGLVHATRGEARIFGQPAGDPEARRRIGYLPENFRFHDWLTGASLLDFHARLARLSLGMARVWWQTLEHGMLKRRLTAIVPGTYARVAGRFDQRRRS